MIKKIVLSIFGVVVGFIVVACQPRQPARMLSSNFYQMAAETGCDSGYSEDKKADLFKANYENGRMTVIGTVVKVDGGQVLIKVLPRTLTYDLQVDLTDSKSPYDLRKGEMVTVSAVMQSAGGCILPYSADPGRHQEVMHTKPAVSQTA